MTINEIQKWPTDKVKYDKNYIRLYGIVCKYCKGKGCPACNWLGGFDNVKVGDKQ